MTKYKETLQECKEYEDILDVIEDSLHAKKIKVNTKSDNELIIGGSSKEDIKKIVYSLSIPKQILNLLISIHESRGIIYVRKKLK